MKHTPGPWSVVKSSNPANGDAWRNIVSTGEEFSPAYVGEALERDASLIAAAPDLLEALENLLAYPLGTLQIKAALAAIAKAKGEDNAQI